MKFEDYIQFCSYWARPYLTVWSIKCWDEDWAKKVFSENRPLFYSRAEEVERTWSSFEDFSEVGSGRLVEMFQMVSLAQVGLEIASKLFEAGEEDARVFHLETLFRYGLLGFLLEKQDPYNPLSWWAWLGLYAPVIRELESRGSKHIGFPGGLYKLLSTIEGWSGALGVLDEAISGRMDTLLKKVRLSKTEFSTLKNRECNFQDAGLSNKLTKNEIRSQAAVTLAERWNDDPFYVLADSLDGKLNIAPRAVADAVRSQLRRGEKREYRIKLHLSLPEDDPHRISAGAKGVELPNHYAGDTQRMIDRWAAGSKDKKRFVGLLSRGFTREEIAKELGKHKNTVTNWKKELFGVLRV